MKQEQPTKLTREEVVARWKKRHVQDSEKKGEGMKPRVRVLLIVYIVVGGAMALSGVVMVVIQLIQDLTPIVGPSLLIAGLVQFFVGVWLFKRQGKGILG